jgi:hypothetical protein
MTIDQHYLKYFARIAKFTVILSFFPILYVALFPSKIAIITMACSYPLTILLWVHLKKSYVNNFDGNIYILFFVGYNLIILLRGIFDANSGEDWRVMLSSTIPLFLFVHFSIYLVATKASFVAILMAFLSYGLVLCFIIFIIPVDYNFKFPQAIAPICIMAFMIPYLSKKYTILIVCLAVISFFSDLTNRSNFLNIIAAAIIVSTFFWRNKIGVLNVMKRARHVFLILPILFLFLGLAGWFNVFLIGKSFSDLKIGIDNGASQEVFVDSRTSIYVDVFNQLVKDDAVVFGLGASGKTATSLVDVTSADFSEIYKEGRRGTESGMLNYIQWGGLVGGLLYFLLFVKASYYGIYRSKNWFCIMLGLWVAYKGLYSFIEDRIDFSISSIFILLSIGICMNKKIRQMTDIEMKIMFEYVIRRTVILRFLNSKKIKKLI